LTKKGKEKESSTGNRREKGSRGCKKTLKRMLQDVFHNRRARRGANFGLAGEIVFYRGLHARPDKEDRPKKRFVPRRKGESTAPHQQEKVGH